MTFLENLEAQADGSLVFTSQLDGRVWSITPGADPTVLAQVPGRATSIASAADGEGWLVFGTALSGLVSVFLISRDGDVKTVASIPDAIFPNGVQRLSYSDYLLVDSAAGVLWNYDHSRGTVSAWIEDDLLRPLPGEPWPGANGVKVFGDRLYVTNTARQSLVSVELDGNAPAGRFTVEHEGVGADDFAFGSDGTAFLATHPFDAVLKLTPDHELTRIAGPEQGVRACTACRFGRTVGDETTLYVITNGGIFTPWPGGVGPALVVALDVGMAGAPVDRL
jgi:hypothetical protein